MDWLILKVSSNFHESVILQFLLSFPLSPFPCLIFSCPLFLSLLSLLFPFPFLFSLLPWLPTSLPGSDVSPHSPSSADPLIMDPSQTHWNLPEQLFPACLAAGTWMRGSPGSLRALGGRWVLLGFSFHLTPSRADVSSRCCRGFLFPYKFPEENPTSSLNGYHNKHVRIRNYSKEDKRQEEELL